MKLRVGLLGFGYWGPILARNLAAHPMVQIAAVGDPDPTRRGEAAASIPGVRVTDEPNAIIDDPKLDAVVVATPAASHFGLARRALAQGKHLLVEKPLVVGRGEAEELGELAARRRLVLMTDHTFVFAPAARCLSELVGAGEIGALVQYSAVRIALGRFRSDVNVLWDLAVHDVAVLDSLVGRLPASVAATAAAHFGDREDVGFVTLSFDDGLIASLHATWLAPVKIRRTLVGGTRRTALWDDLDPTERLRIYEASDLTGAGLGEAEQDTQRRIGYRAGDVVAPLLIEREPLAGVVGEWVEAISTGREPLCGAESSLRVVRILDAAERSRRLGGRPVDPATGLPA